ncbi:helix-turn-helix domain-containing protein [Aneurinibacillus tyrosinisolvens]|uniref:helix-turn-helix domain-containing protein n=1 Tax=Aneurinibacillus tyrosinisolvens TaxID=1443435 RepID=UPI00069C524C|nr:helix-turn-helix domain-containing protein [Aneurinibacillus tyrosinisolvens]
MSIIQSAHFPSFKELSTFSSLDEMNLVIRKFLYHHSHILNDSTIAVFKTIAKHSCKIFGVCWLKIDSLSSILSLSRSTVERAIRILKKYNIISTKRTQRKQGGYGHNVFILQKFESNIELQNLGEVSDDRSNMTYRQCAEIVHGTSVQQSKNDTETGFNTMSSKRNKKDRIEERKENVINIPDKLDESFTPSNVPEEFKNAIAPFYRSAKEIYELWGKVRLAAKGLILDYPLEQYADVAIQSFKESVFALKNSRIKAGSNGKAFMGYYYGTLFKKFNNVCEQEYLSLAKSHEELG